MPLFFSYLMGRPVLDSQGRRIGKFKDLVVTQEHDTLPQVTGVVTTCPGGRTLVPMAQIARLDHQGVRLSVSAAELPKPPAPEDHFYLRRDLLDAQVVDVDGAKVVRVNDLILTSAREVVFVSGLDIGTWGLLRRLGWANVFSRLARLTRIRIPEGVIAWNTIEPIVKDPSRVHLRVKQDKLVGMHPADLAEIFEELGVQQRAQLVEELSNEQLADLLEESEPHMQSSILSELEPERAADVLEEMEPDEAADLLGELSDQEAQAYMHLMEPEEADELRQLLSYEEDTAGAMMTTSYLGVDEHVTIADAVRYLREECPDAEVVAYFYLLGPNNLLRSVTSVRRVLLAEDWSQPLAAIAHDEPFTVQADASRKEVAEMVARYNLTAMPVVDDEEHLLGVVSVHDVLEETLARA
ncbi:MAG TPA: CBS domain-containing protein [Oscillatoriaceae cyanobacterium]